MAGNSNLGAAKKAKNDEFYTQLTDIEKELKYYRKHFKGKTVFCNCDDPFESNFFKYFVLNFNRLGLKKLICTCYSGSPVSKYRGGSDRPYKAVVTTIHDTNGDGGIDMTDVRTLFENGENELTPLQGDGDFRSDECLGLMDESDIVVTNPPFSLFREYVHMLMEHEKKFVIIGNQNAITYKEIFPLIMENKLWVGASFNKTMEFIMPDSYELKGKGYVDEQGRKHGFVSGVCWYINLDIKKRHEELILVKKYNPVEYPKYDNYDAINVNKVSDIPCDYDGVIGVPITFMDKYNPDQFEIIGMAKRGAGDPALKSHVYTKDEYPNYSDLNATPTLWVDGKLKNTYPRILIRNKHPEPPKGV